ncbi:MAG: hypothetical protein NC223_06015 [Butyrivibrio sp.]|nr:hypothetical protein [Butyrivibrio sp.]
MKKISVKILPMLAAALSLLAMTACQNKSSSARQPQTTPEATKAVAATVVMPEDDGRPRYVTRGAYPGDWKGVVFEGGRNMIYVEDLAAYADTGVTIEVGFTLEERDYYVLGICDALNWEKLYKLDSSYISGVAAESDAFDSRQIPTRYVYMQSDGCISLTVPGCKNAGIDYDIQSFTFKLTPEGIKYLTNKDSEREGIILQTYGVNVRYVLLEADEIDSKIK